jgi:hypothetical protein
VSRDSSGVGQPRPRVYARLLRRRVAGGRPAAIAAAVEAFRLIGSHGWVTERLIRQLDTVRGHPPQRARSDIFHRRSLLPRPRR